VTDTLAVLARLGTMFERTASVRDDDDLHAVLEDVASAISEVLGYRVVVINRYRAAFDDLLTATAVGAAEESGLTFPPPTTDDRLVDRLLGDLEMTTRAAIARRFPDEERRRAEAGEYR